MISEVKGSLLEMRVGISDEETWGSFWGLGNCSLLIQVGGALLCLLFMYMLLKDYLNKTIYKTTSRLSKRRGKVEARMVNHSAKRSAPCGMGVAHLYLQTIHALSSAGV